MEPNSRQRFTVVPLRGRFIIPYPEPLRHALTHGAMSATLLTSQSVS